MYNKAYVAPFERFRNAVLYWIKQFEYTEWGVYEFEIENTNPDNYARTQPNTVQRIATFTVNEQAYLRGETASWCFAALHETLHVVQADCKRFTPDDEEAQDVQASDEERLAYVLTRRLHKLIPHECKEVESGKDSSGS
tara:strand:- start:91 stop:507 length:417 start_codon:yes stop_codon:yes gene_type:complete